MMSAEKVRLVASFIGEMEDPTDPSVSVMEKVHYALSFYEEKVVPIYQIFGSSPKISGKIEYTGLDVYLDVDVDGTAIRFTIH